MKKVIKKGKSFKISARSSASVSSSNQLIGDIRSIIDSTRTRVAQMVNSGLVLLSWQIGKRLQQDVLGGDRAAYGDEIVSTVSRQLTREYGPGYSKQNLLHMLRFVEMFPEEKIVSTLSRQLGWSHFKEIIYLDDRLKRDFYAEMCRIERWSVRTLRAKINGMLFERTGLSKKPAQLAKQELVALRAEDRLTPDLVFRDPYFLNFLGLTGAYSEKDLESAILRELERFSHRVRNGFHVCGPSKAHGHGQEGLLPRSFVLPPWTSLPRRH